MVITDRGIVATSQTLASQAGAQVLARGGSAMDAAIAANAVLGVVEPESDGIGGDLFAIYWDAKTGKLSAINASGWAPTGLTIDFLKSQGQEKMPQAGIHSVTVPGCVDGWAKLHQRFGKLPWAELFQPAIYFAGHGYPVTEMIGNAWKMEEAKLARDQNAPRIFLRGGHAPKIGEVFRDPEMAAALKLIATQGPAAFYKGAIAQAILKTSQRLGGKMTAADLAEFQSEWVEPISTDYHGWKVYELPPNGQGIAAIEMLNLFSQFPMAGYPPRGAGELHTQIEAQKLAYADLRKYIGDQRFTKVPLSDLISMDYARERAKSIDLGHASCVVPAGNLPVVHGDTIYISVVDRDGNIVSLIQSVYDHFGSGVVVDGYGFVLQNRGGLFLLEPRHPDALAPRKRPLHTIIPAFMEKGDRAHGIRHHGRTESGAGARAIRFQRSGPRDEYPDGFGSAAFHQEDISAAATFSIENRIPAGRSRGPDGARPPIEGAGRFLERYGRRTGRAARLLHGCELGRFRPAQRWRGCTRTGAYFTGAKK